MFGEGQTDEQWLTPKCTCGGDCHAEVERFTELSNKYRDEAERLRLEMFVNDWWREDTPTNPKDYLLPWETSWEPPLDDRGRPTTERGGQYEVNS